MCNNCYNLQINVCDGTYTFPTTAVSEEVRIMFTQYLAGSQIQYAQDVMADVDGNITVDLEALPGDLVNTASRNIRLVGTANFVYDEIIYSCINIEFIRVYE